MAPRKYTEAQKQSARKWDAANLDRLSIALPAGSREKIKAHAAARGESTNAFIGRAIQETMERDTGGPQETTGPIPLEALKTAQEAAEAAGEAVPVFVARAIESRATLDKRKKPKGGQQNEGG